MFHHLSWKTSKEFHGIFFHGIPWSIETCFPWKSMENPRKNKSWIPAGILGIHRDKISGIPQKKRDPDFNHGGNKLGSYWDIVGFQLGSHLTPLG